MPDWRRFLRTLAEAIATGGVSLFVEKKAPPEPPVGASDEHTPSESSATEGEASPRGRNV